MSEVGSLLTQIQIPFGPEKGRRISEASDGFLAWAVDNWLDKPFVPEIVQAGIRTEWALRRPRLDKTKLITCAYCKKTTDDPVTVDQVVKICRNCYAKR